MKIIKKYNSSKQMDILQKINFYKNGKIYKTIKNDDFGREGKNAIYVYHSPNKKYFAVQTEKQFYEGGENIKVEIYDKNGVYQWKGVGRDRSISHLSNNGDYFIHTSNPDGACYDECDFSYVTRRYRKDIKLDGGLFDQNSFKQIPGGKIKMTLSGQGGNNYVVLGRTGGLKEGNLYKKKTSIIKDKINFRISSLEKIEEDIIFDIDNFDRAYEELLNWEKDILFDIGDKFNIDVIYYNKRFEDIVINNKPARVVRDGNNKVLFGYSFVTDSKLIIYHISI